MIFFSSGSYLPFLCKLCEQIFFCSVHQHDGDANYLLLKFLFSFIPFNLIRHLGSNSIAELPGTVFSKLNNLQSL